MSYCTIKDALLVEKEGRFYPPCQKRRGHRIWPFDWQSSTVAVVRPHMPLLRIRYRIQAFCGYEAEEGVATDVKKDVADEKKSVATKSENTSVVIVDAESESESENVVDLESNEIGNENVAMVESENEKANAVIGIGNAVIEIGSIVTEKGSAVTEKGSIVTKKENALKKNVSVKCHE